MTFSLITPEGVKFESVVWEVILPTPEGQIAVLPHHVPLITLASAGVVSIYLDRNSQTVQHLATSGGLISIKKNIIQLLADTAERAEDIDELRAKQALERAHEMQTSAKDHISLADATRLIERNVARIKVAEIRRKKHP